VSTTRTKNSTATFRRPFVLRAVGRALPAGDYEVITDEEMIEGVSFAAYRRVATMMILPGESHRSSEMITVEPEDLEEALARDAGPEEA
jgi:hypothetical protein